MRSWSSLISIVTGLCTGQSGFWIPAGEGFFFCPECPDQLWGPTSLLFNGCRGSWWREEQ